MAGKLVVHVAVAVVIAGGVVWLTGCATCETCRNGCCSRPAETREEATPSLQARLDAYKAEFVASASPELVETFEDGVEAVRLSGITRRALRVGDQAVDFRLPDPRGRMTALHELRAEGPVVVLWYRGGWCPYCNIQLRAYQEVLEEMRGEGARVVAISPEVPGMARQTAGRDELDFLVLSDVGNKVARRWGLVYTLPAPVVEALEGRIDLAEHNGDRSHELPLAATYVVDRGGMIRYAFVSADYRERAEPADVLAVLKTLK